MMYPKKVLMIGWEYPPHNSGGLGVACEGMTKALADQQTQIYFTLPYQLPGQVKHMQVMGCYNEAWDSPDQPPFSVYSSVVTPTIPSKLDAADLRALPQSQMEQKVQEYADLVQAQARSLKKGYDVIHAHDWMSFPAALKIKKQTGKPLIAHVHSTEYDRIPHGNGSPYITTAEYEGMHGADIVIAVSYYTKRLLVQKYNLDPRKIAVVHNGISPLITPADPGRHHFASKRPIVVFMGRLTAQKGTEYFMQLASRVNKVLPEVLFVVAGHGDMYYQLLMNAAYRQLSASVLFSGFVRDKQKDLLLDRADLFIMPSLSEPFGLVALEAAQRQTPVIISKNAGVSEVMPHAKVVDFWDVEKMTDEVIALLQNHEYYQQVTHKQAQDVAATTWTKAATKIRGVYRKAFLGR